ncbi:hypothetical protein NIIDMKKI_63030 [Mycobacterium kansasii]|uniref:Large ribosomal subunit protein uL29 n=1 Tax=Mycobacterium kansasii TaxID=1768 RepID=A0A7G1IJY9_MYCKA|nr:hypothetical protein NIIDMKKI_63030 [Mycobacterium kansasii]
MRSTSCRSRHASSRERNSSDGSGNFPGELRELTDEELTERLREAKGELFNLRFQMATGQLNNIRRLRTVRREIARVYTVLRERELGLASGPDGPEGPEGKES